MSSTKKGMFSDFSGDQISSKTRFAKLIVLDTLSYFEEIEITMHGGATRTASGIIVGASTGSRRMLGCILDLRTGEIFELTKNELKKIIKKDQDLLKAFEKESGKQRKLGEYLMYYTARKRGSRELPQ